MMLAFAPLRSQASMMAADGCATGDKVLSGLNYYDFYIDYFNSTFGTYQIYNYQIGSEGWVDLGWSIQSLQDLSYYYNYPANNAKNCFYDWCLRYVDTDNDSITGSQIWKS